MTLRTPALLELGPGGDFVTRYDPDDEGNLVGLPNHVQAPVLPGDAIRVSNDSVRSGLLLAAARLLTGQREVCLAALQPARVLGRLGGPPAITRWGRLCR